MVERNNMIEIIDIDESYTHIKINGDLEYGKIIIDTLSVYEEGYQFSPMFRQRLWDGKKHFYEILDNQIFQIPKGLTPYIIKDLRTRHKEFIHEKITYNDKKITEKEFNEFIISLKTPFMPYDYQEKAALDAINDKRTVLSAATSAGKSFIIYLIVRWMMKENKRTMISVPSIGLVTQMAQDFKDYGWNDCNEYLNRIGGDFKGDKTMSKFPITLTTWQSAQYFKSKDFNNIDCIIVDEAHSLGSGEVLTNIVNNAKMSYFRIGMTGTVPKVRTEKLQLLGTLGPVKKVINAKGLIDRGLATDVDINCIFLKHSTSAIDNFYRNCGQKPKYPDEEKYLSSDAIRNTKVAKMLVKISGSGNTIGLFSKTAHGELILKKVIEDRTGNYNFNLLHKFTPKPLKEAYSEFQKDSTKLFYINKKLELADRKKLINNMSKIALDEKDRDAFIDNVKSLDDLNIFFYNGDVDASTREYIRQKLEVIETHNNKTIIDFIDFKISIYDHEKVLLTDGSTKVAKDITEEDDICNEWIEKHKPNTKKE
jgi:superfamily II DNA or RNA helicase